MVEIWSEIDSHDIVSELKSRLNKLRNQSFNHLIGLPEFETENVCINGTEVSFTTYREMEKSGSVEIIIQARVAQRNGMIFKKAQVSADGFRMTSSGETGSLPMKILYSYM
jgi:hypothetical protein